MEPIKSAINQSEKALKTGPNSIRENVSALMSPLISASRMKAIKTIAKNNNISFEEAQFRQAVRIAQSQAKIKKQ